MKNANKSPKKYAKKTSPAKSPLKEEIASIKGQFKQIRFGYTEPSIKEIKELTPEKTLNTVIYGEEGKEDEFVQLYIAKSQANRIFPNDQNNESVETSHNSIIDEINENDAKSYLKSLYQNQLAQIEATTYLNDLYQNATQIPSNEQITSSPNEDISALIANYLENKPIEENKSSEQDNLINDIPTQKLSNKNVSSMEKSIKVQQLCSKQLRQNKIVDNFNLTMSLKDCQNEKEIRSIKMTQVKNSVLKSVEGISQQITQISEYSNKLNSITELKKDLQSILKSEHTIEYVKNLIRICC